MAHHRAYHKQQVLFGGDEGWKSDDWTSSDDRVRGGKSQSYLDCDGSTGKFHGTLDIKTLGGAGFASQRTTGDDREWDLSEFAGIQLCVIKGDKKRYTLILKDELLEPDPETGREQSTISYECDFELPSQAEPGHTYDRKVFIPWTSLNATYRGRLKKDAKAINLKNVKRFSIMMRSFFGAQEGDFSLSIHSICVLSKAPKHGDSDDAFTDAAILEKGIEAGTPSSELHSIPTLLGRRPTRTTYLLCGTLALLAVYFLSWMYPGLCT